MVKIGLIRALPAAQIRAKRAYSLKARILECAPFKKKLLILYSGLS
jgi:hypothetical protein